MRRKLLTVKWGRNICGEHGPDTDLTVPDARNRSPWQKQRWHSVKLGLRAGDTGCIRYAGQPSHRDHDQREKKKNHLSAFAFFQQRAKNNSAGTEQGKADYTFWLMVPYIFREIHTEAWFTCTSVLETGPGQTPGPKYLKLLGNSEEDLNLHLYVALYQSFFNYESTPCFYFLLPEAPS